MVDPCWTITKLVSLSLLNGQRMFHFLIITSAEFNFGLQEHKLHTVQTSVKTINYWILWILCLNCRWTTFFADCIQKRSRKSTATCSEVYQHLSEDDLTERNHKQKDLISAWSDVHSYLQHTQWTDKYLDLSHLRQLLRLDRIDKAIKQSIKSARMYEMLLQISEIKKHRYLGSKFLEASNK